MTGAPTSPKVFLSITRPDLSTQRRAIEKQLLKLRAVVVQSPEDVADVPTRLQETASRMSAADALVIVVGECAGERPPPVALQAVLQHWDRLHPGMSQRLGLGPDAQLSYSQLESRLAFIIGKPVHLLMLADDFPYDRHVPEPPAMRQSQVEHRRILSGVNAAPPLSSPAALLEAVRKLPIFPKASSPASSPHRLMRLMLVAAVTAALGGGGLFAWKKWSAGQTSDAALVTAPAPKMPLRSPQEIIFDIACQTLKPTWPGDFSTHEERRARAAEAVAQGTGMDVAKLKTTVLDPWATSALAKSIDVPFELGLALYWLNDARSARQAALKEFEAHPPSETAANERAYKACLLAAAAAYAAEDLVGANEELKRTRTFPHDFEGKGTKEERAEIYRQEQVDDLRHAQRLAFFAQTLGVVDGFHNTWETTFKSSEVTSQLSPDEVVMIMCRQARELATIGRTDEANKAAARCVEATEKLHGRDSRQVVLALCIQAGIHAAAGEMNEAEAVLTRAANVQRQHFASDERLKATVLHGQASAALMAGKVLNVDSEAQVALEIRLKQFGPDHIATLESTSLVGQAFYREGEVEKAMAKFLEVQSNVDRLMGKTNLHWLLATRDLAMARRLKGDLNTAYEELKECARLCGELGMRDTIEGALTQDCFGVITRDLDPNSVGIDGAVELHQDALASLQKMVGSQHRLVARVTMHFGAAQYERGEFARAEQTLRQALALYEKDARPAPLELAETLYFLGRSLGAQDRDMEGLSFQERGVELCNRHCYLPSLQHAMALHSLARCFAELGRMAEAHGQHSRAEEILGLCTWQDHWARARSHLMIGGTLQDEGRLHEAFDRYSLSYKGYRRVFGRDHQQTFLAWRKLCEAAVGGELPEAPPQPLEDEPVDEVVSRLRTVRDEVEKRRSQDDFSKSKVGA